MRHHRRADGADAELRLQSALRDRDRPPRPTAPDPGVPARLVTTAAAAGLADAAEVVRSAAAARLPGPLRDGVVDPRSRGAWTIVAVVVVAGVAAGLLLLRARPEAVPVAPPRVDRPATTQPVLPSQQQLLVVDVTGAVRRPGLRRLPPGSRVADAIKAAGGVLPGTKQPGVNLARKLVDGEQIVVGGPAGAGASGPPGGADPAATGGGPVNLNTATKEQLDSLSGVGPVTAQRIIEWREAHGGFTSVDQLREVDGIGERRFASLRPQVTV